MSFLESVFSIKNNGNHKVLTILGIKIKFNRVKNNLKWFYKDENSSEILLSFETKTKKITFTDIKSAKFYRNISTVKLLYIVMQKLRNELNQNYTVKIVTSDFAKPSQDSEIWGYARKKNTNIELIPDFFFDSWPEIGCKDYDEWCRQIVENSKKEPEIDALFWSGAIEMNTARKEYYELSQIHPQIICDPVIWKRETYIPGKEIQNNRKITLVEHTKYKYLIDLPCGGYSGRFKVLLFTGRPVFKVDDDYEEFFYKDLKPFIHYIPVKRDMSDLVEQLKWAESNYEQALQIGQNAQNYALTHLTRDAALNYLEKLIRRKMINQ